MNGARSEAEVIRRSRGAREKPWPLGQGVSFMSIIYTLSLIFGSIKFQEEVLLQLEEKSDTTGIPSTPALLLTIEYSFAFFEDFT
jgi:hypothetical protein